MDKGLRFVIPSLPPSVNALYYINFRTRQVGLKPEVAAWKSEAKSHIPIWTDRGETTSGILRVDSVFTYNWYYQNGKLRQFDTPNMLKALFDVIAEKLGVNDSFLKSGSFESRHSEGSGRVECTVKYEENLK